MNDTFQPLLTALRQNMPPDPDVDASEWEAPELDDEPDFSDPIDGSPEDIDQRIDDALYPETTSPAITPLKGEDDENHSFCWRPHP